MTPRCALFPKEIIAFVQRSQPQFWEWFAALNQGRAEAILLESLVKELASKGMLTVLREGFKCFGRTVRAGLLCPQYGHESRRRRRATTQNRLTIVRQVETRSGAIPDVVLAVNGLPVVCLELKNPMTGQNVENAK